MTTKATLFSRSTFNSFFYHCKRYFSSPEGVAFIFCKVFQRVWHDLPLSFTTKSTLTIKSSYKITLFDFLDNVFCTIYGVVLMSFVLIEPLIYSKLNWIHISFYLGTIVGCVGCLVLNYQLVQHKKQLKISFNALAHLKKHLDRGKYCKYKSVSSPIYVNRMRTCFVKFQFIQWT